MLRRGENHERVGARERFMDNAAERFACAQPVVKAGGRCGAVMAINSISRWEFDAFGPSRGPLVGVAWEEVEWFADEAGNVIGVLTHDLADDDWGYAVLGRDRNGVFRAVGNDVSIKRQDKARTRLIAEMETLAGTCQTMFPQGDEG